MSADPRWVEDLPALAAEAYALAGRFCGACRDYHALWPYRRITLKHGESEMDQAAVGSALAELMADGGKRVLIAGAADSGVLATVARASGGQAGEIRVVDLLRDAARIVPALRAALVFAARNRAGGSPAAGNRESRRHRLWQFDRSGLSAGASPRPVRADRARVAAGRTFRADLQRQSPRRARAMAGLWRAVSPLGFR